MAYETVNATAVAHSELHGMTLQFAASHAVAGLAGAGLVEWVVRTHAPLQRFALVAAVAALAGALGIALTLNVRRGLSRADGALTRLTRGQPLALAPRLGWPLGQIGAHLTDLDAELIRRAQHERAAIAFREQALRQAMREAAQEERSRLARELHDSIKQQIFSISVSAAAAQTRLGADTSGAMGAIGDVRRSAHEAQVEMQALLQQLRPAPLVNASLVEALRTQCEALGYRSGARVRFDADKMPDDDRLPLGTQESLFRITQEVLANVARHARAEHVDVALRHDASALTLTLHDDGQGFDPARTPGGMGLENVNQRAEALGGSVLVTSMPGGGTTVLVRVPLTTPQPLEVREVDEPLSAEAESARVHTEKALQLATNGFGIAGLSIFLGLPLVVVALGIALACGGSVRARLFNRQVAHLIGAASGTTRDLRAREREVLSVLPFLLGLGLWYLPVVGPVWGTGSHLLALVMASLVCGALAAVEVVRWLRTRSVFWGTLHAPALRAQLKHSANTCLSWAVLWIIVVVLAIAFGVHPALPPRTAAQWSDFATVAILARLPIDITLEYLQTRRWHRQLARSTV